MITTIIQPSIRKHSLNATIAYNKAGNHRSEFTLHKYKLIQARESEEENTVRGK